MSTQQVQIKKNPTPTPTQPAVFSPEAAVANVGDNLTWHNADSQDHWPAPSASNKTGWFPYQIPPGSESRGDLALGPNNVTSNAATNANPVVFTTVGPAPATNVSVTIKGATGNWKPINGTFVATNLGPNSFSIDVDSSGFGPWPTSGTPPAPVVVTISIPGAYKLSYVCALHPAETGTITVNPQQ